MRTYTFIKFDIRTAYLHAPLQHDVFVKLPNDLPFPEYRGKIAKLNKAIYGLKQAGFEWYWHLRASLEKDGWSTSVVFPCTYKRTIEGNDYFILCYVDDLLIIGKDINVIDSIKSEIKANFEIEDSGPVNFLLGMRITRDQSRRQFIIDQEAYIERLGTRYNISGSHNTPCSADINELQPQHEAHQTQLYQSKIGALLHVSRCSKRASVLENFLNYVNRPAKVNLLCDNMSTIAAIKRDDVPPKLKHIRVQYHSVKEQIKLGYIRV